MILIKTKPNMNRRIESSFNDIRCTVNHYEKYKETYKLLKTLPLYQNLKKKNINLKTEIEKLKSDNKKLLDIICSFPSFSFGNNPKSKKLKPLRNYLNVKKESKDQDDVCILDSHETPNIIVNIIDDEESFLENKKNTHDSSHEDGEEEEAEEEEAEEEEAEAEEEVEEEEAEAEEAEAEEAEEEEVEEEEVEEEEVEEEEAEEKEAEEEEAEEEEAEDEEADEEAEEEADEEAEEEEVQKEEVEETDEVQSVMINNKEYYTTNPTNGVIYDVDENGEINNEVGAFKNGVAKFY